jgi:hypothetical protein
VNEKASPIRGELRFTRTVAVLSALVLLGGLAGAYQVGVRANRAPSFDVGGELANPDDFPSPGVDGRGYPYGNVLQQPAATGDPAATTVPPTGGSTAPTCSAPPSAVGRSR